MTMNLSNREDIRGIQYTYVPQFLHSPEEEQVNIWRMKSIFPQKQGDA